MPLSVHAADFITNELNVYNAPAWVKRSKIENVTESVQAKLEWTIRRVNLYWHTTPQDYAAAQNLGAQAVAVTKVKSGVATIHMGPLVNAKNYQQVVGHELVHVIIAQKYKNSIPSWLEEGLANYFSKKTPVNYKWLASQELPTSVDDFSHPFKGAPGRITFRYIASQALAEMLDKKCDLQNLIRLSVERKLEDYIARTCEIADITASFNAWVKKKSK